MSDGQWYELDIRGTNKDGETFDAHVEYQTTAPTSKAAVRDFIDVVSKAKGSTKVVEIDATR
jgi:hypothetical protein